MWASAGLAVVVLAGVAILALRPTTVTATPRSAPVVFDSQLVIHATPLTETSATGTLAYTLGEADFEDSATVAANGTEHAEEPATGLITVYNEYSDSPTKLIKNTRFESPDGLIFRVPESVSVPGRSGTTPGSITVTVIADQPGDTYNIPPSRFTVPGLKSSPDMYQKVYAVSTSNMEGGFLGERPAAAPGALERAKSDVRAGLEAKAREEVASIPSVFPEFIQIRYQSLPPTTEADGSVRIHERAHVTYPIFDPDRFANTIARATSANVSTEEEMRFVPDAGLRAVISTDELRSIGTGPFQFTLEGSGKIIWSIDAESLREAVAGKDTAAFQNIASGFSGVSEAHARVSPFWSSTFPSDPSKIKVEVIEHATE